MKADWLFTGSVMSAFLAGGALGVVVGDKHARAQQAAAAAKPSPEAIAHEEDPLPTFTPPKNPPTLKQLMDGKVPGTYGAKKK